MVALDAGVHLSAIHRILEETLPSGLGETEELALPYTLTTGPFAGLEVPHATAAANAAHIHRTLIDTYLITHPHLDHIAGFVINTAGLPGTRPKRLAGLPSTIAAFKIHIFNNVIWPNLSDENNGAGLVTYMRLVEGGSPALGEGEGKGYLEISDGLAVKIWGVSHGHCIERHSHRGSSSSSVRHGSFDASSIGPMGMGMGSSMNLLSPRSMAHHHSANSSLGSFLQQQQRDHDRLQPGNQGVGLSAMSAAASAAGRAPSVSGGGPLNGESVCVYDSSAYFIRDVSTGREILMFGDVEPDSVSLSPRNHQIWQEAAPKIAAGKLAAIFIECSYDDSQSVDRLFGHLTPRFIIEEMTALASEVRTVRIWMEQEKEREKAAGPPMMERTYSGYASSSDKKRKRMSDDSLLTRRKATHTIRPTATSNPVSQTTNATTDDHPVSPKTVKPRRVNSVALSDDQAGIMDSPHIATPTAELSLGDIDMSGPATPLSTAPGPPSHRLLDDTPDCHNTDTDVDVTGEVSISALPLPLAGLKVVIIHVKEKLNDGPQAGDIILEELQAYEEEAQLGCEFVLSSVGQSLYL